MYIKIFLCTFLLYYTVAKYTNKNKPRYESVIKFRAIAIVKFIAGALSGIAKTIL